MQRVRNYSNLDDSRVTMTRRRRMNETYSVNIFEDNEDEQFGFEEVPTYMALADFTVTPSGFSDMKQKIDLLDKVQIMSGEVCHAFTSRTSMLLTAHANTDKVKEARKRNIPVVSIEWLEKLWIACESWTNPYIHASATRFKDYMCPLFYNLQFIMSKRMDKETRLFYEKLIKDNGGIISKKMKSTPIEVYFYVCQGPENERAFEFAQKKNIACVPLAWICDSVSRGTLSDIEEYRITEDKVEVGLTFSLGPAFPNEDKTKQEEQSDASTATYVGFETIDGVALESYNYKDITLDWVASTIQEMVSDEDHDYLNDSDLSSFNQSGTDTDEDSAAACA